MVAIPNDNTNLVRTTLGTATGDLHQPDTTTASDTVMTVDHHPLATTTADMTPVAVADTVAAAATKTAVLLLLAVAIVADTMTGDRGRTTGMTDRGTRAVCFKASRVR